MYVRIYIAGHVSSYLYVRFIVSFLARFQCFI